jgi:hypothetical protein
VNGDAALRGGIAIFPVRLQTDRDLACEGGHGWRRMPPKGKPAIHADVEQILEEWR